MYEYEQNPNSYTPPERPNGMETASIILGILGLVGSSCCYLAIPFGAIGIILALLSKGRNEHISSRGKTGLVLCAGSLILTASLTGYTMYKYRDVFNSPEFRERMKNYLEYYYSNGETEGIDDFLDDFFNDGNGSSVSPNQDTPGDSAPYDNYFPYEDPYNGSSPYVEDPYGGSSPYVEDPYGNFWDTIPYGGGQNGGSHTTPGPEV